MPIRALVVDDDETFCQLLATILRGRGLDADWTTESLTGYNLSLQRSYDLFIVDVRMPLLEGTEFAKKLKKEKPEAKIILISAFADEALRQTAASLGVALLSKPFTPDHLLNATAELLGCPV